jgi:hypothetical protein
MLYVPFIVFLCISFINADRILITTPINNEYLVINCYYDPCEKITNYHDDEITNMYNSYCDELCNGGKNMLISCYVKTNMGYKSCSNNSHIDDCLKSDATKNKSWIDRLKYLTRDNYTFCQNKEYLFELTFNNTKNKESLNFPNEFITMISIILLFLWFLNPGFIIIPLWIIIAFFVIHTQ